MMSAYSIFLITACHWALYISLITLALSDTFIDTYPFNTYLYSPLFPFVSSQPPTLPQGPQTYIWSGRSSSSNRWNDENNWENLNSPTSPKTVPGWINPSPFTQVDSVMFVFPAIVDMTNAANGSVPTIYNYNGHLLFLQTLTFLANVTLTYTEDHYNQSTQTTIQVTNTIIGPSETSSDISMVYVMLDKNPIVTYNLQVNSQLSCVSPPFFFSFDSFQNEIPTENNNYFNNPKSIMRENVMTGSTSNPLLQSINQLNATVPCIEILFTTTIASSAIVGYDSNQINNSTVTPYSNYSADSVSSLGTLLFHGFVSWSTDPFHPTNVFMNLIQDYYLPNDNGIQRDIWTGNLGQVYGDIILILPRVFTWQSSQFGSCHSLSFYYNDETSSGSLNPFTLTTFFGNVYVTSSSCVVVKIQQPQGIQFEGFLIVDGEIIWNGVSANPNGNNPVGLGFLSLSGGLLMGTNQSDNAKVIPPPLYNISLVLNGSSTINYNFNFSSFSPLQISPNAKIVTLTDSPIGCNQFNSLGNYISQFPFSCSSMESIGDQQCCALFLRFSLGDFTLTPFFAFNGFTSCYGGSSQVGSPGTQAPQYQCGLIYTSIPYSSPMDQIPFPNQRRDDSNSIGKFITTDPTFLSSIGNDCGILQVLNPFHFHYGCVTSSSPNGSYYENRYDNGEKSYFGSEFLDNCEIYDLSEFEYNFNANGLGAFILPISFASNAFQQYIQKEYLSQDDSLTFLSFNETLTLVNGYGHRSVRIPFTTIDDIISSPTGSLSCVICSDGFYCPKQNIQLPCPIGFWCPPGSSAPQLCPAGYYCSVSMMSSLSSNPTKCVILTSYFCPLGSSSPLLCPYGLYSPDGVTCSYCGNVVINSLQTENHVIIDPKYLLDGPSPYDSLPIYFNDSVWNSYLLPTCSLSSLCSHCPVPYVDIVSPSPGIPSGIICSNQYNTNNCPRPYFMLYHGDDSLIQISSPPPSLSSPYTTYSCSNTNVKSNGVFSSSAISVTPLHCYSVFVPVVIIYILIAFLTILCVLDIILYVRCPTKSRKDLSLLLTFLDGALRIFDFIYYLTSNDMKSYALQWAFFASFFLPAMGYVALFAVLSFTRVIKGKNSDSDIAQSVKFLLAPLSDFVLRMKMWLPFKKLNSLEKFLITLIIGLPYFPFIWFPLTLIISLIFTESFPNLWVAKGILLKSKTPPQFDKFSHFVHSKLSSYINLNYLILGVIPRLLIQYMFIRNFYNQIYNFFRKEEKTQREQIDNGMTLMANKTVDHIDIPHHPQEPQETCQIGVDSDQGVLLEPIELPIINEVIVVTPNESLEDHHMDPHCDGTQENQSDSPNPPINGSSSPDTLASASTNENENENDHDDDHPPTIPLNVHNDDYLVPFTFNRISENESIPQRSPESNVNLIEISEAKHKNVHINENTHGVQLHHDLEHNSDNGKIYDNYRISNVPLLSLDADDEKSLSIAVQHLAEMDQLMKIQRDKIEFLTAKTRSKAMDNAHHYTDKDDDSDQHRLHQ